MIWQEPLNHYDNCYFYLTDVTAFISKKLCNIVYPNFPSAMRPALCGEDLINSNSTSILQEISDL